ncbi:MULTISPECIES: hypothetical protein [unclassified Microcoleus]|uniref:hypothetical protein n=1 Tax=unclassified Microcoleus TaxID=2642155 RepID=UPI002FD3CC4B
MKQNDDRAFPEITYVGGASGELVPVLRATRLRVQTVVVAAQKWGFSHAPHPTLWRSPQPTYQSPPQL